MEAVVAADDDDANDAADAPHDAASDVVDADACSYVRHAADHKKREESQLHWGLFPKMQLRVSIARSCSARLASRSYNWNYVRNVATNGCSDYGCRAKKKWTKQPKSSWWALHNSAWDYH